jgi:putative transposase
LIVESWWHDIPRRFPGSGIDAFVVMPNHLHGIVVIESSEETATPVEDEQGRHIGLPLQAEPRIVGADRRVCPVPNTRVSTLQTPSLPRIIQWFKTMTTNDYLDGVKHHDLPLLRNRLWQRNYYEHIIRSDRDLDRIRSYIDANPSDWANDEEHPILADR